jgi:hypothetical protein
MLFEDVCMSVTCPAANECQLPGVCTQVSAGSSSTFCQYANAANGEYPTSDAPLVGTPLSPVFDGLRLDSVTCFGGESVCRSPRRYLPAMFSEPPPLPPCPSVTCNAMECPTAVCHAPTICFEGTCLQQPPLPINSPCDGGLCDNGHCYTPRLVIIALSVSSDPTQRSSVLPILLSLANHSPLSSGKLPLAFLRPPRPALWLLRPRLAVASSTLVSQLSL